MPNRIHSVTFVASVLLAVTVAGCQVGAEPNFDLPPIESDFALVAVDWGPPHGRLTLPATIETASDRVTYSSGTLRLSRTGRFALEVQQTSTTGSLSPIADSGTYRLVPRMVAAQEDAAASLYLSGVATQEGRMPMVAGERHHVAQRHRMRQDEDHEWAVGTPLHSVPAPVLRRSV